MGNKNKEGGKKAGGEASALGHKNKGGGRKAGGDASSSAKAGSVSAPSVNFNPKDVTDPYELLDMCVAAFHDKYASAATRESALASLAGALEGVVPLDEAADGRATSRLGLLALTLRNGGSTEILAESFPMLARTLQQALSKDEATVTAALDCLAAVTFAGALGPEEAERSLKAIMGVVCPNPKSPKKISSKVSPQVVAAAVSTWMFLVTTAAVTDAQRKADRAAWAATVASLAGVLLEADDRAVRMAAGEALAVCVELNLTQDMEAVQARVSDLAVEAAGKGADKTLFLEQKDLFRQISAYMERGERPRKALRTSSDRREFIKVSTWAKIAQLNFLRRFLAGGFLGHVKGNKLFKETFDIGVDEKATLSIAKRKLEKGMKMNRELARAVKNVYCLPQGGPPESNMPDQLLKLGWH
ncbi:hypothetical protein GQ55_1G087200 [Panicum hallii var. hallii]|uniref:Interferon-related developmental regulator N-terminal domain-containing protein n=1 Tax=Panicum hallii var. hallii TaxID=1504633 RepID=A0A2T7F3Q1_9POAL|nr:hypothetical protein GQ55_1G087200 [Panicum hallii var. hallii]